MSTLIYYAIWKDGEVKGYIYLEPEQAKILNELNLGIYFGFDKHTSPDRYKMKFELYQLKKIEENIMRKLMGYEWLKANEMEIDPEAYELTYTGTAPFQGNVVDTLETLFSTFNAQPPADFTGRSMSVSDVVMLDGRAYYCDNVGFKPVFAWNK